MSGKPAARVTDPTTCPVLGHGSNPIVQGSPDVVFDGLPAARQGDASACGSPMISAVSSTVLINGLPAVTLGSIGAHGNVVIGGSGTVLIGDCSGQPIPDSGLSFSSATAGGNPSLN
ncbi:PAAR domain-containing protein, partial [Pseudomonas aeruginosa]|nr:PAAR domain-containing protein [Pseudomonas aeruginosa]MCS8742563.1 PAAR domain-containing protein [Pseudomonas aeruginosa]MCS8772647.1 PAAR domain-containing protein [Pseudomonas aeruginosa]MCS8899521.1 PAAR domain-containing protein [Pseudomonas aeruginosa]MCS8917984.1 PAAR domain-containing protein [Pseudomonas aeruginosa]